MGLGPSRTEETIGSLDILVNNAGIERSGPVLDLPQEDWDAVIDTNLTGSFLCAKHAGRAMVAAGNSGKMINIGSIYSVYGTPEFANYGASKAGVLGLTRALAIELAPHNIQVNAILPGWYEMVEMSDAEAQVECKVRDDLAPVFLVSLLAYEPSSLRLEVKGLYEEMDDLLYYCSIGSRTARDESLDRLNVYWDRVRALCPEVWGTSRCE